ncbi:basic helix-loop-helix ARNT-like protein 1 isoform X2 [Culicoides brevitarsis]|uniref:basic helix-loop-helix ARNT-like protein 1 isoform X2 n=1 Tax=Culicoides brevitarsis TaxID=469753 RepID=UPI00307B59DB
MVTIMDAYEYHQGNNPDHYTSTDDEDLDRKDFLLTDDFGNFNETAGYEAATQMHQTHQNLDAASFYGGPSSSYMGSGYSQAIDVKPIIPPLVAPTYLQQYSPSIAPPSCNDYLNNYLNPGANFNNNQNYFNKPWFNQVKPEQMANILNSSGREARNRAEKNRRDKLNNSITEISAMVPHVADAQKRVDKTAVLRFAVHALRIPYVFGNSHNEDIDVDEDVLDRLFDGFMLTICCGGQIVLISKKVEQYLGHCQTDLLGQNLKNITHPEDIEVLTKNLVPSNLSQLFETRLDENGHPAARTPEEEEEIDRKLSQDRRKFVIRLARPGPRSEPTSYEAVTIDGSFRRADRALRGEAANSHTPGPHLMRRSRVRPDDSIPIISNVSQNDIQLVACVRKYVPIHNRVIMHYEYKTRHLMDGRIIDVDERISLVAGYMTDEIRNASPFSFMHRSDMKYVVTALRQMYDTNQPVGYSCYRLLDSSKKFIYLRTSGRLEVNKDTGKVETFVCVNTLVSEEEGLYLIREMKNRLNVIIQSIGAAEQEDSRPVAPEVPATANLPTVEGAILSLIENFPPANALPETVDSDNSRDSHTTTPQIIVPVPESIKSTVTRSADVLGIIDKKHRTTPKIKSEATSPSRLLTASPCSSSSSSSSSSPSPSNAAMVMDRPSVLRNYSQKTPTLMMYQQRTTIKREPTTLNGTHELLYQKTMKMSPPQYENHATTVQQSTSSVVVSNGSRSSVKRTHTIEDEMGTKRRIVDVRETELPSRLLDDSNSDFADIPDPFSQLDLPVESLVQIFDDATDSPRESQDDLPHDLLNGSLNRSDRRIN